MYIYFKTQIRELTLHVRVQAVSVHLIKPEIDAANTVIYLDGERVIAIKDPQNHMNDKIHYDVYAKGIIAFMETWIHLLKTT